MCAQILPDAPQGIPIGRSNVDIVAEPRPIPQPSSPAPIYFGAELQQQPAAPNLADQVVAISSVRSRAQSAPPVLRIPTGEAPPLAAEEPRLSAFPAKTFYARTPEISETKGKGKHELKASQVSEGSRELKKMELFDYIPPTEYVDVSGVFVPLKQLVLLGEMVFYLHGVASCFARTHIFFEYMKTLSHHVFYGALVAPITIGLAALFAFRSIFGIFAINFATPSHPRRALFRLAALVTSRIVFGKIMIIAAAILKNELVSDDEKELIAKNIAHLIRYATKEPDYMEEINRLQQTFHCCGTVTSIEVGNATYTAVDHPWNIWFATYSLDETYPNIIRELYSLPWSCCNMTAGARCEHIGISRYLRKFSTPTDYNDVETALHVNEMNWNPSDFDHYVSRNELAVGTLYTSDCSKEMSREVVSVAELLEQEMYRAGVVMAGTSVVIVIAAAHLCVVVNQTLPPAASFASTAIKQKEEVAVHSEPKVEQQVSQAGTASPAAPNS